MIRPWKNFSTACLGRLFFKVFATREAQLPSSPGIHVILILFSIESKFSVINDLSPWLKIFLLSFLWVYYILRHLHQWITGAFERTLWMEALQVFRSQWSKQAKILCEKNMKTAGQKGAKGMCFSEGAMVWKKCLRKKEMKKQQQKSWHVNVLTSFSGPASYTSIYSRQQGQTSGNRTEHAFYIQWEIHGIWTTHPISVPSEIYEWMPKWFYRATLHFFSDNTGILRANWIKETDTNTFSSETKWSYHPSSSNVKKIKRLREASYVI